MSPRLRCVLVPLLTLFGALPASAWQSDFEKEFKAALQQKATAEQHKLVKTRVPEAVACVIATGEQILVSSSDELEALMAGLREAWKAVHKSEFAERAYKYYSLADGTQKKDRAELKLQYDKARRTFDNNLTKKAPEEFDLVYAQLRDHPDFFDQAGDLYLASESAYVVARALDETLRTSGADLHLAWKFYVKAIELRERWELKDPSYEECVKRRNALAAKGADKKAEPGAGSEPGGSGPGMPAAPGGSPPGAPLKAALTFEVLASPEQFQRPNYHADDSFPLWPPLALTKKDKNRAVFANMNKSPAVLREGSNDVRLDTNGDGKGDEKVPLTGNIVAVKTTIGEGADARPWAFLAVVGGQKEFYQGIEVNLQPVDDVMTIYTLGAASVVGSVEGKSVRLIDETMDGIYGTVPQTYGFAGLSKDVFQPDFDTMVVGAAKRARPFSEWAEIEGAWYHLAVDAAAKELTATPHTPDVGFLKLDLKGTAVPPSALIVQGKDSLSKCFYDLADAGPKGLAVPVGNYVLCYGELRRGKKKQLQKCAILPGRAMAGWSVRRGETTLVELGAPFDFDFKTKRDGDNVTIEGATVRVIGRGGERYERTWNCVPAAEVGFRKKGVKAKPGKYERLPIAGDVEVINKQGWDVPWSPMDLVLDVKSAGPEVEFQLVLKKHDLFGKIESNWKE